MSTHDPRPVPGEQIAHPFAVEIRRPMAANHWIWTPRGFDARSDDRWPLVIFLHGAGERGDDLEKVKVHGPPRLVAEGRDLGAFIVSPQCPDEQRGYWDIEVLDRLLDALLADLPLDPARVVLTGLSMGGFAVWSWAIARPDRFAGIAPICGGGDPRRIASLERVPVWAFHGALDPVVPLARSVEMVEALRNIGGDVRLTVYDDAGHDAWTRAYASAELQSWLVSRRRAPSV
jgi:predicted peptidase